MCDLALFSEGSKTDPATVVSTTSLTGIFKIRSACMYANAECACVAIASENNRTPATSKLAAWTEAETTMALTR